MEVGVDVALGQRPSSGNLPARLYAGQPAEPHEIEVADAEGGHRRGVVGDGAVAHLDPKVAAELVGDRAVQALELLRILVGDGPDRERLLGGTGRFVAAAPGDHQCDRGEQQNGRAVH